MLGCIPLIHPAEHFLGLKYNEIWPPVLSRCQEQRGRLLPEKVPSVYGFMSGQRAALLPSIR